MRRIGTVATFFVIVIVIAAWVAADHRVQDRLQAALGRVDREILAVTLIDPSGGCASGSCAVAELLDAAARVRASLRAAGWDASSEVDGSRLPPLSPDLARARAALRSCECRVPPDMSPEEATEASFAILDLARAIAATGSDEVPLEDAVIGSLRELAALERTLRHHRTLIVQRVRLEISKMIADLAAAELERGGDSVAIVDAIASVDPRGAVVLGFQGEVAAVRARFVDPPKVGSQPDESGVARRIVRRVGRPFRRGERIASLEHLLRQWEAIRSSYPTALSLVDAVDAPAWTDDVSALRLLPSVRREGEVVARLQLVRAAAALAPLGSALDAATAREADIEGQGMLDPLTGRRFALTRDAYGARILASDDETVGAIRLSL